MAETKTTATQVGRDAADKVRESMATNELAQKAKDAAYTIVGLGVMGAQRATAATKQATQQLARRRRRGLRSTSTHCARKTKDATDAARRQFTKVDEVFGGALARIEEAFAPIEERLPAPAKETVQKVRVAGKGLHAKVQRQASRARSTHRRRRASARPTPTPPKGDARREAHREPSTTRSSDRVVVRVAAAQASCDRLGDDVAQRRRRGRSRVASPVALAESRRVPSKHRDVERAGERRRPRRTSPRGRRARAVRQRPRRSTRRRPSRRCRRSPTSRTARGGGRRGRRRGRR